MYLSNIKLKEDYQLSLYECKNFLWKGFKYIGPDAKRPFIYRLFNDGILLTSNYKIKEEELSKFDIFDSLKTNKLDQDSFEGDFDFNILVSPMKRLNGKEINIYDFNDAKKWFVEKCQKNGILINRLFDKGGEKKCFYRKGEEVPLWSVELEGSLSVFNKSLFLNCVKKGLGRKKPWGCGMFILY